MSFAWCPPPRDEGLVALPFERLESRGRGGAIRVGPDAHAVQHIAAGTHRGCRRRRGRAAHGLPLVSPRGRLLDAVVLLTEAPGQPLRGCGILERLDLDPVG